MIAENDEQLPTMLAAYVRLKIRLVETETCLTSARRMLDSSRLTVAQCRRMLDQGKART